MKSSILRKVTKKFNGFRNPECRATTIRNGEVELEVEFIIDEIKRISDDKFIVRYKKEV